MKKSAAEEPQNDVDLVFARLRRRGSSAHEFVPMNIQEFIAELRRLGGECLDNFQLREYMWYLLGIPSGVSLVGNIWVPKDVNAFHLWLLTLRRLTPES